MTIEQLEQTVVELQNVVHDLALCVRGYVGSKPKIDALNRIDTLAAKLTQQREPQAPPAPDPSMQWRR